MRGFAFNRQKPIDEYIVDFYCSELNLVIEIDGISHGAKIAYDEYRDYKLKSLGLSVLHFDDVVVKKDVDSVLRAIDWWIEKNMAK
jgi:very-short-patch-repair endonuclease